MFRPALFHFTKVQFIAVCERILRCDETDDDIGPSPMIVLVCEDDGRARFGRLSAGESADYNVTRLRWLSRSLLSKRRSASFVASTRSSSDHESDH